MLEEYKDSLADKYTATELVALLEDSELIDVWDVLEMMEEKIIELRAR